MHIITLKVKNKKIYEHITSFLRSLNIKELEIIENEELIEYKTWNETEIANIGKIGFLSKSFVDDEEYI